MVMRKVIRIYHSLSDGLQELAVPPPAAIWDQPTRF
jgi:hypothetical protein